MAAERRNPARIVYFSDAPWAGGAEKYLYLLATNLERDVFEPAAIVNRNRRLDGFAASLRSADVPVHEVSMNLPYSGSGVFEFINLLRRLRPSILHCNLPGPWGSQYSLVAPLARLAGVPHVVTTEHLPMVRPFWQGKLLRRLGGLWIERVITVSDDNVGYLTSLYGVSRKKIRVVRIGIPDAVRDADAWIRRKCGIARDDFLCIMVGSLEERKGHAFAFQAMASLGGNVKLLVAGSGECEHDYRQMAAALGIEGRVHFLGYRTDVETILKECDALLCPSTVEATPYCIIEAMAAGIPVIASRVHGIPEIVVDGTTGILIDPARSEELVAAIEALARNREIGSRMGESGRRRWEEAFRIERCIGETEAVYRELLAIS
ncbi:MAG: glycosyltransferase [Candidatus Krumholzibacteria bacterium]|nr:glycosyltransferase [Candidatus Krumholzibacteria bacterium]